MILVNLLPHRAERRKARRTAFIVWTVVAGIAGFAIVGFWYVIVQGLISSQQQRNQFLQTEISKLDLQIKDIATLRSEIDALKARQKAVEDLQTDRNTPVYVLNELVRQTPEGVYFTSVRQDGQILTVAGIAQTNERVSELLRNTAYNSEWLTRPELVEIKATTLQSASREQKRLFDFSMKLTIRSPQDSKPAAVAQVSASAPMGAASSGGLSASAPAAPAASGAAGASKRT